MSDIRDIEYHPITHTLFVSDFNIGIIKVMLATPTVVTSVSLLD